MLQVQTQETLTRQQGVSYEELETGFWLLADLPQQFATDLPFSVTTYITLELLHTTLKLYLLEKKKKILLQFFATDLKKENELKRK